MSQADIVSTVKKVFGIEEISDVHLVEQLGSERQALYQNLFEGKSAAHVGALLGDVDGVVREFIYGKCENGQVEVPCVSCQVTFEDMSPSECVEYCFADEEPYPSWHIATVSVIALEDFKAKKFKLWEHQLRAPECEAAFRRLLQQGPIRHVYDKFIFPTPVSRAGHYKVIDEHSGKTVDLPHQVDRMRIWNAHRQAYDEFDPSLAGAPKTSEEALAYWSHLLNELRELRGRDYIDSLLGI